MTEGLAKYCQLISICPEVGIGLGVPREKIQLTQIGETVRLLTLNNRQTDLTETLTEFSEQFMRDNLVSGLVLQDRSPSCGLGNTPVFSTNHQQIGLTDGLFVATILRLYPTIAMIRQSQLQVQDDIENFVSRMRKYPQVLT